jgi:hypothetical protein
MRFVALWSRFLVTLASRDGAESVDEGDTAEALGPPLGG